MRPLCKSIFVTSIYLSLTDRLLREDTEDLFAGKKNFEYPWATSAVSRGLFLRNIYCKMINPAGLKN